MESRLFVDAEEMDALDPNSLHSTMKLLSDLMPEFEVIVFTNKLGEEVSIKIPDLVGALSNGSTQKSLGLKEIKGFEKIFSWENYGDIIREIGRDKPYITFINKSGKRVKVSLLDLDNIGELPHDYIVEMINFLIGASISSPEGLEKVRRVAQKSYDYLRNKLLYTEKELQSIGSLDFQSSIDVVNFFKATNRANGIKKCMLLKVARVYLDADNTDNDELEASDDSRDVNLSVEATKNAAKNLLEGTSVLPVEKNRQKTLSVLEKKVLPNLISWSRDSSMSYSGFEESIAEFKESGEASFDGDFYFTDLKNGVTSPVKFKIDLREKSIESAISKSIREKDYVNQGDIMDLLGICITTDPIEDKLKVMNLLSQLAFKYGEYRIKNKDGITREQFEEVLKSGGFRVNESNVRFAEILDMSFDSTNRRASTATGYKDIKMVPSGDGNSLSFEIMFLDEDSENQNGLAHHKCFEYKRIIAERIRLENHVTYGGIKTIARSLVDDIVRSSMKDLKGKKPTELLREALVDVIVESDGKLIPSTLPNDVINKSIPGVFNKPKQSFEEKKRFIQYVLSGCKKDELAAMLREVLPDFYAGGLIPYCDSRGRMSQNAKTRKFTNKVGKDNFSVLAAKDRYLRLS